MTAQVIGREHVMWIKYDDTGNKEIFLLEDLCFYFNRARATGQSFCLGCGSNQIMYKGKILKIFINVFDDHVPATAIDQVTYQIRHLQDFQQKLVNNVQFFTRNHCRIQSAKFVCKKMEMTYSHDIFVVNLKKIHPHPEPEMIHWQGEGF